MNHSPSDVIFRSALVPAEPLTSRQRVILAAAIVLHVALVVDAAQKQSPVIDEPRHLVAGVMHRRFGRLDNYIVNPPLPRTIASFAVDFFDLDLSLHPAALDKESDEAAITTAFVRRNEGRLRDVFTLARWLCLPFTFLGIWACFSWSRDLYGASAGVLSTVCWCAHPSIVTYAGLITPDLAASATAVFATWRFHRWLQKSNICNATIAGVSLGIALLTKSTLLLLPIAWLFPMTIRIWCNSRRVDHRAHDLGVFVLILVLGIYILNLGYGFDGSGTALGDLDFVSPTLTGRGHPDTHLMEPTTGNRFRHTLVGKVPVPFPALFVLGIDLQQRDFDLTMPSYLRGEWRDGGWWYYYSYAFLIKSPIAFLILIGMRSVFSVLGGCPRRNGDEAVAMTLLLCFPIIVLVVASSKVGFCHHLRYILPLFPFLFVWVGKCAPQLQRTPLGASLLALLMGWMCIEPLSCHPYQLAYANELVGGSRNTHHHLLESNCDWGQDLYALERWIKEHPDVRPIVVDCYGLASQPTIAGLQGPDVFAQQSRGQDWKRLCHLKKPFWAVVSVQRLKSDALRAIPLSMATQIDSVGYSIQIYKVECGDHLDTKD